MADLTKVLLILNFIPFGIFALFMSYYFFAPSIQAFFRRKRRNKKSKKTAKRPVKKTKA